MEGRLCGREALWEGGAVKGRLCDRLCGFHNGPHYGPHYGPSLWALTMGPVSLSVWALTMGPRTPATGSCDRFSRQVPVTISCDNIKISYDKLLRQFPGSCLQYGPSLWAPFLSSVWALTMGPALWALSMGPLKGSGLLLTST